MLNMLFPLQHKTLLKQLIRRDVLGRYRSSMLGALWSVLGPLSMLAVYTFVFVGVFRSRWPGGENGGGLEFALQVFAGLVVFNLFAEIANRSPGLILEQTNLVKKVAFPLQVLPWTAVAGAMFHAGSNLLILLLAVLWQQGHIPLTALALPLILLAFLPFLLGIAYLLAALGPYVRDIAQAMGMLVSFAMFLSPVFYPAKALPENLRYLLHLNPLTPIIENLRLCLLSGQWPDWAWLLLYFALSSLLFVAGAYCFNYLRKGFADVV